MNARKERQRTAMIEEVKTTARRLMTEHGTAGVSLRLVAREMGMSAPSLYYYFANYDALITALLVDAFNALADALAEAAAQAETPVQRLLAATLGFRSWAIQHPTDFQLIYGNPIPGFHAPREVTVPAVVRSYVTLGQLLDQALNGKEGRGNGEFDTIPPTITTHLQAMREQYGYTVSNYVLHATLVLWTRMYGSVMLELYGHLGPAVGDPEAFYNSQIAHTLRNIGVDLGLSEE